MKLWERPSKPRDVPLTHRALLLSWLEGSLLLARSEHVLVASVLVCARICTHLPCWAPPSAQSLELTSQRDRDAKISRGQTANNWR